MADLLPVRCSLAIVVESCHITICYTIGVYMVHHFLDNSADESQIGTLTGLLVRGHVCLASAHISQSCAASLSTSSWHWPQESCSCLSPL